MREHVLLDITGMSCASCVRHVEKALTALPGVAASVNFATNQAIVDYDGTTKLQELLAAVSAAGYEARLPKAVAEPEDLEEKTRLARHKRAVVLSLVLSAPFVLDMVLMLFANGQHVVPPWLQWLFASIILFTIGREFFTSAWRALLRRTANMDTLVSIGTGVAYVYSTLVLIGGKAWHLDHALYFDATAIVLTLVFWGKYLELLSRRRSAEALTALMKLQPMEAWRETEKGLEKIPVQWLKVGDSYVVRPGDTIPVDGVVTAGQSTVNEAMMTGESMPVEKSKGSELTAGTINQDGLLHGSATGVGENTRLKHMVRMVAEAQGSKAPIQKTVDQVAAWFVPAVCVIALLTFLVNAWLGNYVQGLVNAVAVLVIACPCVLGLATPMAIMVGVGRAAQLGIVIKQASSLERAHKVTNLIMDKTGTLTEGEPVVQNILLLGHSDEELCVRNAASLEQTIHHPLARAVVAAAQARGLVLATPKNIHAEAGLGLQGELDGDLWRVGAPRWFEQLGFSFDRAVIEKQREQGHSLVMIAKNTEVLALLSISDRLRSSAQESLHRLSQLGVQVVMVTGDQEIVARDIAAQLGLTNYRAGVLPEHKVREVGILKQKWPQQQVGMVGDGVNDAPALAAADVSFALGAGTSVAMAAADITLLRNDLRAIPQAIELSRATLKIIHQNLFFAFSYNIIGLPVAAMGMITPALSGAFMAISSLLVVTNAMRLARWRPVIAAQ